MRRHPKFVGTAFGLLSAFGTFIAFAAAAVAVGKTTNSGLLGICGPYGPHADLVGLMFLGSLPAGVLVGAFVGWRIHRRLNHSDNKT